MPGDSKFSSSVPTLGGLPQQDDYSYTTASTAATTSPSYGRRRIIWVVRVNWRRRQRDDAAGSPRSHPEPDDNGFLHDGVLLCCGHSCKRNDKTTQWRCWLNHNTCWT